MKTQITILVILFILFNIASSNAFDEKARTKLKHIPFYELSDQQEQYPSGYMDMKEVVEEFMEKGDAIQGNEDYLIESIDIYQEKYGSDLNEKYNYTYNENNQILTKTFQYWLVDKWITSWRRTYTYDNEEGYLLIILLEIWRSKEWVNREKYSYSYDDHGNILTYIEEAWLIDSNEWIIMSSDKNILSYDLNGNLITNIHERMENEEWVIEKHTWSYDINGNTLTWIEERLINKEWVNILRYSWSYDSNGNQLTSLREDWWQSYGWVKDRKHNSTYDLNNNLLIRLYEKWLDTKWIINSRSTYTYDTNGNLLNILSKKLQNNEWVATGRQSSTYDKYGNLLSRLWELWRNDEWINYYRFNNTFDPNGNLLIWVYEKWEQDEWINYNNIFSYKDSNGNSFGYLRSYKVEITWGSATYSISMESLSENYCQGDTLTVSYTTSRTFNDGNVFTVQLSDASGDFANPIEIGSLETVRSGIIEMVIPRSTEEGTAYRIRVAASDPVTISEDNGEDISIYLVPQKPIIIREEDILTSNSLKGNQWFLDGDLISGATEQNFNTNQVAGIYTVQVTSENGCVSDISDPYDFISRVEDLYFREEITVFPNPFTLSTIINFELTEPGNVILKVYDMLGYEVAELVNEFQSAGGHSSLFNANNHPNGMYYYTLQIGQRTESGKLLLVR